MIEVGDLVNKRKGYRFPGKVVSVFRKLDGTIRIVVECTIPEVEGMLHIYNPNDLEIISKGKSKYLDAVDKAIQEFIDDKPKDIVK